MRVPSIVRMTVDTTLLRVEWSDGVAGEYLWLWLRDHSHDERTIHPTTGQRQLATAAVDPAIRGATATEVDESVVVTWTDGSEPSTVPVDFLLAYRTPGSERQATERVLWDSASIGEAWPAVEYDAVMSSDDAVAEWLDQVARFGFCIVTGTPTTMAATESLLRRVGYVRGTIFGGMWEFQADLAKADTAYTSLELGPHTDGTYSHDAPGLQLLHCLAFDGTGGESTMVDGFRIAAQIRVAEPELYDVLSTVRVPGQYLGDGAHLRSARAVFRHDADGLLEQVSFNNADRAPFILPPAEMTLFYDALRAFERRANDQRLQWRRANPPGHAMLFDNWRVLHGRLAYSGRRHMCGGYVNREDFESRRRVTARQATAGSVSEPN